ncbi:hypothetical protein LshimejAT787_0900600 [Lyophyllum shimeji]|uniref:Uncharacterized protein n=1 Tax=Lyophyllum shimeji TaxID=47721 RepID=A0A9P3PQK3_LYOSH|nr:hypothetical protein LshimejAT787_0900600 [Lyophyllum shimeji]
MVVVGLLASIHTLGVLCAIATDQQFTSNLPYNFTLIASNSTFPDASITGVPLVLGQNGATTGATVYVTSTYASYPYNDYPSLALTDHSLRAFTASGEWFTNATAQLSGRPLAWLASKYYRPPAAQDYSAVHVPAHPFPLLAAHGMQNLWSLCSASGPHGQVNVVFNVPAGPARLGFDPARCYAVMLHMIKKEW